MLKGKLNISIPVEIEHLDPRVKLSDVERMFQFYVTSWSDGRYPYSVELLHDGIDRCLKRAIYDSLQEKVISDHEGEYDVTYNSAGYPNGKTATWIRFLTDAFRKVFSYVRTDEIKVCIR